VKIVPSSLRPVIRAEWLEEGIHLTLMKIPELDAALGG
jgi:hypothetical protein